jgi:pyruvate dehydrogenase E2 component (dihydrolipoamide acetyltransferase)
MANLTCVVMPKWGMEMTEGELAEWHVAVGEAINAGSDIVDVETAKIVNTVTSNDAGTVVRLCAAVGDILPVGGVLVVLADGDASEDEIDAFLASRAGSAAPDAAADPEPVAKTPSSAETSAPSVTPPAPSQSPASSLSAGPDDSQVAASPVARRVAAANDINLNNVVGTGRHGRISLEDLREAAARASVMIAMPQAREFALALSADDSALNATPVARRLAASLGVNLNDCRQTGRHGRISKADVEVAAARLNLLSAPSTGSPASRAVGGAPVTSQGLTGARRAIAGAVSKAKQEVPHFRVNVDVDMSAAMSLRKQLNNRLMGVKISLNDILLKACAAALADNPRINARFDGETLEHHTQVNIASAVATDNGVLMPVLQNVGTMGWADVSIAMRDLATRAKTGHLSADEMTTATFSVSNLGMFGIDSFDAIINQPAVTILAVGAAQERPVVRGGQLVIGSVMSLSLASDHRVVDGADAARFMADLRALLEEPALMLV